MEACTFSSIKGYDSFSIILCEPGNIGGTSYNGISTRFPASQEGRKHYYTRDPSDAAAQPRAECLWGQFSGAAAGHSKQGNTRPASCPCPIYRRPRHVAATHPATRGSTQPYQRSFRHL